MKNQGIKQFLDYWRNERKKKNLKQVKIKLYYCKKKGCEFMAANSSEAANHEIKALTNGISGHKCVGKMFTI